MIEIDLKMLKEKELTPSQYVYLLLFEEKKHEEIEELGLKFLNEDIKYLTEIGYIEGEDPLNCYDPRLYNLTDKFQKEFKNEFGELFEEFWNAYPKSVKRNGLTDTPIRGSKKKVKEKYRKIIGQNVDKHRHILKMLETEIKLKEMKIFGSIEYMKTLPKWLSDENWKETEEFLQNNSNPTTIRKEVKYGEGIE